jgi:hypothetical protein
MGRILGGRASRGISTDGRRGALATVRGRHRRRSSKRKWIICRFDGPVRAGAQSQAGRHHLINDCKPAKLRLKRSERYHLRGRNSMLAQLDEILNKFVSVFLLPIINMICLSFLFYWSVKGITFDFFKEARVEEISGSRLGFVSEFVKQNLTSITSIIQLYKNEITSLSYFMAATTSVLLILLIYLCDRVVYYIGLLAPPVFSFDIDRFSVSPTMDSRQKMLGSILGKPVSLSTAYGIIRSYLGERNADKNRLEFRGKLVKGIEITRIVITYIKSYLIISLVILIGSIFPSMPFSPGGAIMVVLLLLLASLIGHLLYSRQFQHLVEYDVDSFIWERIYKADTKFDVSSLVLAPAAAKRRIWILHRFYLRPSLLNQDP